MDLAAVKQAPAWALAEGAVAAARNAHCLVEDGELLSGAGRLARAFSLAGLAVEEVGKAGGLATLAAMPENLRARAPVGRMLEWHQMKLVEPAEITAAEVREQLDRARHAASAVNAMLDPSAPAWLANPGAAGVEFSRTLVMAFGETGHVRSAEAAADVLLDTATKMHG